MSINGTQLDILSLHRAANAARTAAIGTAFATLGRWLSRYTIDPIRAGMRRRAQYEQLMAMDERQLRDLGLTRATIAQAMKYGREDLPAPANANAPVAGKPKAA